MIKTTHSVNAWLAVVEVAVSPALLVAVTLQDTVAADANAEVEVAVRVVPFWATNDNVAPVHATAYPVMVAAPELVVPGLELAVQVTTTALPLAN